MSTTTTHNLAGYSEDQLVVWRDELRHEFTGADDDERDALLTLIRAIRLELNRRDEEAGFVYVD
jgi:hypothetical protein